ncbi:hypothetical protein PG991_002954 [Apiospora marii]|uniref:Uncharacterized protein n=1 Tax=Apiospora marii TaxID=335849 RepID=A0ABR1SGX6_9PEZI
MSTTSLDTPGTSTGFSRNVQTECTTAEIRARLEAVPGVVYTEPVITACIPNPNLGNPSIAACSGGNLVSALQNGDVDNSTPLVTKGKGSKLVSLIPALAFESSTRCRTRTRERQWIFIQKQTTTRAMRAPTRWVSVKALGTPPI